MSDEIRKDVKENEVYQDVLNEIKNIGENSQTNYDELQKNYKKLQDEVDGKLTDKIKIEKLKEDILTRQEKIDEANAKAGVVQEKLDKRLDDIELLMKRPAKSNNTVEDLALQTELKQHYLNCRGAKGDSTSRGQWEEAEKSVNKDEFKRYKKAYDTYILKGERFLSPDELKTLSVGVDPHGGYTVLPEQSNQIIKKMYETDPVRQLVTVDNITTDSIEYLADWDEAGCGWVSETGTRSETATPDLNKKKIFVHEMYALPYATQQILEDSAINIENWLTNKISDKFSRTEASAFVTGDGAGKPRGFLTYANGTAWNTVEQTNMGAAAAITADGLIKVKYSLQEFYLNRGTWLMNRLTVRDVMLLKDGTGNYIWKPGITNDEQAVILGLPVRMSTTMPQVAANSLSVVLADWRTAYKVVDRLGISVLRDPYSAKPYVQFYSRKRVGGDVINFDAIKIGKISA